MPNPSLPQDHRPPPGSPFWSPVHHPELGEDLDALNAALLDLDPDNPSALARVIALGQAVEQRYRAWEDVAIPPGTPPDRWTFLAQPMVSLMLDKGTSLTRHAQGHRAHPAITVARQGSREMLGLLLQRGAPTVLRFHRGGDLWLAELAARCNLPGALATIQAHTPADQRPAMARAWLHGAVDGLHPERVDEVRPWFDGPAVAALAAPGRNASPMGELLGLCQRSYVRETSPPLHRPVRDEVAQAEVHARSIATLRVLLDLAPLTAWTYADGHEQPRTTHLNGWLRLALRQGNPWAIEPLLGLGATLPSPEDLHTWIAEAQGRDRHREQGCRIALAIVERHNLRTTLIDHPGEASPATGRRRL